MQSAPNPAALACTVDTVPPIRFIMDAVIAPAWQ